MVRKRDARRERESSGGVSVENDQKRGKRGRSVKRFVTRTIITHALD